MNNIEKYIQKYNEIKRNGIWCKAPFTGLTIAPSNRVYSCCMTISKYKTEDDLNKLRLDMINGNIPDVCKFCQIRDIFNEDNQNIFYPSLIKFNFETGELKNQVIDWLHIVVGYGCNARCNICGVHKIKIKGYVDIDRIKELLKNADCRKISKITMQGGEILLNYKLMKDILHYIRYDLMINLPITIISNGTIMNEEIIGILKHYKCGISISIDGNDVTNEEMRKNCDYNIIKSNMRMLYENEIYPRIIHTISTQNIFNIYENIEQYNRDFNRSIVNINYVVHSDNKEYQIINFEEDYKNKVINYLTKKPDNDIIFLSNKELKDGIENLIKIINGDG